MNDIEFVYDMINKIENETSLKRKIELLKILKRNELGRKVLEYMYDITKVYKIRKLIEVKEIPRPLIQPQVDELFRFLDMLSRAKSVDMNKKKKLYILAYQIGGNKMIEILKRILNRKIEGVGFGLIQKVYPELKIFDFQLAKEIKVDELSKLKYPLYGNIKYDGVRLGCFVGDEIIFITRNSKIIEIPILKKVIEKHIKETGIFLDGELIYGDGKNLNDWEKVMSFLNRKDKDDLDAKKYFENIKYMIFDGFRIGEENKPLKERIEIIKELIEENGHVKIVDYKILESPEEVMKYFDKIVNEGYEGIMLKDMDGVYEKGKRSGSWLKLKDAETFDGIIVGVEEGKGKYAGMLGAFIVEYNGKKFGVGSGLTEEQRKYYWRIRNDLIGKVIEFKCQEFVDGVPRFPVFVRIRWDKGCDDN